MPPSTTPPPSTPAIDRLLERVRRRLARLVWMHGLSTAIGATAVWLAVAFVVDWTLHVPAAIRWIHLGVLALVPGILLARELVRPLARLPRRTGLAVLVERAHPDLHEVLVSAVELAGAPAPQGAPENVADVVRRAEARAATLPLDGILDARGPRRRLLAGGAAALACALLLGLNAEAAGVFLDRLFGGRRAWPRRTQLVVEIPLAGVETALLGPDGAEPAEIRAKVARGQDVPLLVRAVGTAPEEVVLHFKGGERAILASSGGGIFRTLLRSLQEDTEFHATGGDDTDEVPWVRLKVLQPPDVESLAIVVTPPAYSGLPARIEQDRDVEVLQGSALAIHVVTTPRDAVGSARLLPEDRTVPLSPRPFPAAGGADAAPPRPGLGFDLVAEKSLRFRLELTDSTGLSNPDPGLFAINVVEDRSPEIEVLAPSRGEFDTIQGGLIALRVRAEDDFGIADLRWSATPVGGEERPAGAPLRDLEWRPLTDEERALESEGEKRPRAAPRAIATGRARIEVASLGEGVPPADGQQFQLVAVARDNAAPDAHDGRSSAVRVRVVTPDEFVRRLQDRLARVQGGANALAELQREKARRTSELLAILESDEPERDDMESEVGLVVTGERRVEGDARNLAREVCSVCESVLYARLDDRAGPLLDFVDARLSASIRRSFDPAPWQELAAATQRGDLGRGALAGKLVEIVGLALEISEADTRAAVQALDRAQKATTVEAMHGALAEASGHEALALEKIDRLLEKLAEWDNFQSVLALTRDLLHGQKNLQERTKASLKEK